MKPTDITTQVLIEIRDELKVTNSRIDNLSHEFREEFKVTNSRIDETNSCIDNLSNEVQAVRRAGVEAEIRTATALHEVNSTLHDILEHMVEQKDTRNRVKKCEDDIKDLQDLAQKK